MSILLESDVGRATPTRLFVAGAVALLLGVLGVGAVVAKADGRFTRTVDVEAVLSDIGDGLPARSDVKFRGVLVGEVGEVVRPDDTSSLVVRIALKPEHAHTIPNTVTARVVPSNVFAVSSVQLVDNGPAPALAAGATIPQDTGLETVQLQTALTKLRDITAATARVDTRHTLGILATVAEATDRRGADIVAAGEKLDRMVRELGAVLTPDGGPSTLVALSDAVRGLQESAPDLLDAVNHAVVPMRTLAEKQAEFGTFLAASATTLDHVANGFEKHIDQVIGVTTSLTPVLGVMADGADEFPRITTRMRRISDKWFETFWPYGAPRGMGKFIFQFTPHRMYTRADCPRYGDLAGPSCETAPETGAPPVSSLNTAPRSGTQVLSSIPSGGNVGPVGSDDEKKLLGALLGGDPSAAAEVLLGPVARGAMISILPDEGNGPR
ncbi:MULTISPECIES: MlaD family protein [Rhodococcus]|uniref:MCE family protein n=1 Tax=Rhodococcus rhodochrous TaxID=1829 RepID=A0AA46WW72_RHORH|nr:MULTISPECIES: MCE family protein [Rhodococcus]MDC3725965.1 MCE family protein [Rhodococcus sp. Rp3]MDJ0400241.1 MCE family protein [Rhodococcus rhodochrous]UZF45551.1 MCE family protein [Rhodococcus rhodochrous]WSE23158.1 MCE family protein [Rhodococcus sp. PD04]